jgi:pimeloyl-ACP methyl ester carboxylesterase
MAAIGKGPPLLRAGHWLSHVQLDAGSPVWNHWLRELSRDHTFIRYDQRGCGLSDAAPASVSLEAWVDDLEAVVDALGLRRFALFGMSQGWSCRNCVCVSPPRAGLPSCSSWNVCAGQASPWRERTRA